jgi:hypothetical protein
MTEKMDSTKLLEERKAKIQAENKVNEDNQAIANFKGLPKEGETREQLLDRIRKMREEKPKPVETSVFRSEGLQKEYDAEVKAGQEAVAKKAEEATMFQEAQRKAEAEREKKGGPVDTGVAPKSGHGFPVSRN